MSVSVVRRVGVGLAVTAMVAGASLAGAPFAAAAVQRGVGHETAPAQPYKGNPDAADWLGSYIVGGKQVWCVQFAYLAPDSDEQYQPGEALKTKWGTALPPNVAADISYLLLRHADTDNRDDAAALAHLLHSWTAGPQNPGQLDPAKDFREIAYDAPFHLAKLPAAAQAAVQALAADAAANRGPWTATVTAPTTPQTVGVAADWTVSVKNAAGKGVADVPVTITAVDATFPDPATGKAVTTGTVSTAADGAALALAVTPTGTSPKVAIALASPAEVPVVQQTIEVNTQRIVSTGGEKELTATARTAATPPVTTTTPQLPSTIPAGDTPDPQVAEAAVSGSLSGGAWTALGLVALAVGVLAWQLVRRRVVGRHPRG